MGRDAYKSIESERRLFGDGRHDRRPWFQVGRMITCSLRAACRQQ
jgi:hypothetical protein